MGIAPNGKPSNLPENLWRLVRTPEFKRWFGDWERAARLRAVLALKPQPVETATVAVEDAREQYNRMGHAERDNGGHRNSGERRAFHNALDINA